MVSLEFPVIMVARLPSSWNNSTAWWCQVSAVSIATGLKTMYAGELTVFVGLIIIIIITITIIVSFALDSNNAKGKNMKLEWLKVRFFVGKNKAVVC